MFVEQLSRLSSRVTGASLRVRRLKVYTGV
jgi:hypothetical protein